MDNFGNQSEYLKGLDGHEHCLESALTIILLFQFSSIDSCSFKGGLGSIRDGSKFSQSLLHVLYAGFRRVNARCEGEVQEGKASDA